MDLMKSRAGRGCNMQRTIMQLALAVSDQVPPEIVLQAPVGLLRQPSLARRGVHSRAGGKGYIPTA